MLQNGSKLIFNNDSGAFVILFLAVLPLLLTLFFFAAQLFHTMQISLSTHHRCRTGFLATQDELSEILTRLLQMNPEADLLQKLELAAEKALTAAIASAYAPAIAAAKAQLTAIQLRQEAFHFVQNVHLLQARGVVRKGLMQVTSAKEFHGSLSMKPQTPEGLAVEPHPPLSRSPRYDPVADFQFAQSLALTWQVPLLSLTPSWLAPWWKKDFILHGQCAATIAKEGRQWTAVLTRVKL